MIPLPIEYEYYGTDLDWFATDTNGYVVHLASGGGALPAPVVAILQEVLDPVFAHLYALPERSRNVRIAPYALQHYGWLDAYRHYAHRGLFSFNKTDMEIITDMNYRLVAAPEDALLLEELPADVAGMVARIRLPFAVVDRTAFDVARLM